MSPTQLRQIADARLTTRRKASWAEQAEQALRAAAVELERVLREQQARQPVALRSYGGDTGGVSA